MGGMHAAGAAAVLLWAAALCRADIRELRLPNRLTLPGAVLILAGAALAGRGVAAGCGALALGGLYLLVHLVSPAGMGAGDVKLALGLGALTGAVGFPVWVLAALAAPMLTAAVGIGLGLARGRRTPIPHGPAMLLASLAAVAPALL